MERCIGREELANYGGVNSFSAILPRKVERGAKCDDEESCLDTMFLRQVSEILPCEAEEDIVSGSY